MDTYNYNVAHELADKLTKLLQEMEENGYHIAINKNAYQFINELYVVNDDDNRDFGVVNMPKIGNIISII